MRWQECPLLAQNGHSDRLLACVTAGALIESSAAPVPVNGFVGLR
jgi:hypothetical protein